MKPFFSKLNIGIVGIGNIALSHLEAYDLLGLPVVAGCDLSLAARKKFTEMRPQARVYEHAGALISDPDVQLVDLATPHHRLARIPVIEHISRSGKPVFIQKPLAMCYSDALEIVEMLEAQNLAGMVNQNMCFTRGALTLAPLLVDRQVIGKPFLAHIELRDYDEWPPDHWYGKDERWWMMVNTVHNLSLLHLLFGPPQTVYAVTGNDPNLPGVIYDGYANLLLSYPGDLHVSVLSTGAYYGTNPKPYGREEFWIQGCDGLIDFQTLDKFTIRLRQAGKNPKENCPEQEVNIKGDWLPDAIAQGMWHFQQALAAGQVPLCSVQDNLYVMAVLEAAYRSSQLKQAVDLKKIMGNRYQQDYGPGWKHGYGCWKKWVFRTKGGDEDA